MIHVEYYIENKEVDFDNSTKQKSICSLISLIRNHRNTAEITITVMQVLE